MAVEGRLSSIAEYAAFGAPGGLRRCPNVLSCSSMKDALDGAVHRFMASKHTEQIQLRSQSGTKNLEENDYSSKRKTLYIILKWKDHGSAMCWGVSWWLFLDKRSERSPFHSRMHSPRTQWHWFEAQRLRLHEGIAGSGRNLLQLWGLLFGCCHLTRQPRHIPGLECTCVHQHSDSGFRCEYSRGISTSKFKEWLKSLILEGPGI